jgi:hypothetical protein
MALIGKSHQRSFVRAVDTEIILVDYMCRIRLPLHNSESEFAGPTRWETAQRSVLFPERDCLPFREAVIVNVDSARARVDGRWLELNNIGG